MLTVNVFDILLIIIILASVLAGLRSGLARVVVGLVATVVGFMLGFWCYRMLAVKLTPWVGTPALANIIGFLAIFISVLILGSLISALLSRLFKWIGLSWFDHFLGGIAGFLRGVLVIAVLADILVAFAPSPMPSFLQRSRVLPYASEISDWLVALAPRELKDAFTQQMQNLRQFWAVPSNRRSTEV
jgi:membrane protein required for colicin V production